VIPIALGPPEPERRRGPADHGSRDDRGDPELHLRRPPGAARPLAPARLLGARDPRTGNDDRGTRLPSRPRHRPLQQVGGRAPACPGRARPDGDRQGREPRAGLSGRAPPGRARRGARPGLPRPRPAPAVRGRHGPTLCDAGVTPDPDAIHDAREKLARAVAAHLAPALPALYEEMRHPRPLHARRQGGGLPGAAARGARLPLAPRRGPRGRAPVPRGRQHDRADRRAGRASRPRPGQRKCRASIASGATTGW
jgi:hypothetical protein